MTLRPIKRFVPCPHADLPTLQRWLEDMAAQGLHLRAGQSFTHHALFDQGEPSAVRYRLELTEVQADGIQVVVVDEPQTDLAEELGWGVVCTCRWRASFVIYRTADPTVPELHTDPEVQSMALKTVQNRLLRNVFLSFAAVCLSYLRIRPHAAALFNGLPYGLWIVSGLAYAVYVLHRLWLYGTLWSTRRHLERLGTMPPPKDWKVPGKRYRLWKLTEHAIIAVPLIWLLAFLLQQGLPPR